MPERPVGDHLDQALRSAIGLLADSAPPVGDLDDLLASEHVEHPARRPSNRIRLALASAVVLVLAFGALWQVVASETSETVADGVPDSCGERAIAEWCVDGPRGVALLGDLVWTVDRTGRLVAVDRVDGSRRHRSAQPLGSEDASVIGTADGHVLIADGPEIVVADQGGVVRRTHLPRPGWDVVDGAGPSIDELFVIISRADDRQLVGVRDGAVRALTQDVSPESIEFLRDGRIVIVDATTRELVSVGDDGTIVERLFTRMPEGSVSAQRTSIAVLPETGDPSVVLWLSVDDGVVIEWELEDFDPGQPISIHPTAGLLATVDPSRNIVVVATAPPR